MLRAGMAPMIYSFTQISQYLRCPRSYRYRYQDGCREKETRVGMVFGRRFEAALGAYFRGEDCGAALLTEWGAYRETPLEYKKGETWDRLVHPGSLLGGSAADAQHIAAELTGRFQRERRPLPGLALHRNTSALTSSLKRALWTHKTSSVTAESKTALWRIQLAVAF
jgi:PD-(D/E)XK nuclease superfamily